MRMSLQAYTFTFAAGVDYNITAYLSFHPGSVTELMKGAGIDCTVMFNNVSDDFEVCNV